ncbi:MAG: prepilin peptidase [Candidatus Magnetobacterium sp. LHC-1]|uniref:Prepilin leader peptidase/N-methyltransferase n=1 Tax=Candidatus Magnetobacterium casense TaxID=1455061 RepID=A0ABS6S2B0_9BACT|nr:A24 family peptidase [Candidatus Magnetobacterium casensis]MBF0606643.1 prepilin peptidase [Nitrospirota bacterium]MBV6342979.1 prepilin peptidase [Candidatus Magnetobacterium casensis]
MADVSGIIPQYYFYAVFLTTGLAIGSFLNVCIYRLPLELSVVSPPSHCPNCNRPIAFWQNIPLLSYIFLLGRCYYCKQGISLRYPLVELLNGLFWVFAFHRFGLTWHCLFYVVLLSVLIVITFIDIDHQIIPDVITLPGVIAGVVAANFILPDLYGHGGVLGLKGSVIGLLVGGGMFYLIAVFSKGGMGGGDIKLMAMLGAMFGWKHALLVTFIGSFTGSVYGLALIVLAGKGRKTKVPFGPFLAGASVVALFYGRDILMLYLGVSD